MNHNDTPESDIYAVMMQDFSATTIAYNEGEYQQMNMYSNRMVADGAWGRKSHGIVGFFLKNMSIDFLKLGQSSESQNSLKPFASAFISKLSESLKPEMDLAQVWEGYFAYVESSRKLFMNAVDRQVYKDNKTFTATAFAMLAEELLKGASLFEEQGQVTKGFLNESERLIRNHGAEERELVFNSLVIALDRLIDYVKFACATKEAGCVKSHILPLSERMLNWLDGNEELPYKDASDILASILLEWRLYFVRYHEIGRIVSEERKIELPAEAKKRLGDTIADALKRDLSRNKTKR